MEGQHVHAHAVAQVDGERVGFHLLWSGPVGWLYSPAGWSVQRRQAERQDELECVMLELHQLRELEREREARTRLGRVLLRDGLWEDGTDCHVYTLELEAAAGVVRVSAPGKEGALSFALRDGRVVAGPVSGHDALLEAAEIDTVVVYANFLLTLTFCADVEGAWQAGWDEVPYLVEGLQLPLAELDPFAGDEYETAMSRLLPGEEIDREGFERLTGFLRSGLAPDHGGEDARPIERVVQLPRNDGGEPHEETRAIDPLALVATTGTWRRALGLAWFDGSDDLVPGAAYQYRVSGAFPARDLSGAIHGFHTIPAGTRLPTDFRLAGLRVRTPDPAVVETRPADRFAPLPRTGRRGIRLKGRSGDYWPFGIDDDLLAGWSAVLDLPRPARSVELELAPGHGLEWEALATEAGPVVGSGRVPGEPRARISFATPASQIRLRGRGFLYAVRPDARSGDLERAAAVLPPLELDDAGPPAPLAYVRASNLQQPQPPPVGGLPPRTPAPRHELGFRVRWQPATPAAGWPADAGVSPPLTAASYQIEHRDASAGGTWTPLVAGDNTMLGVRDGRTEPPPLHPFVDLLDVYPEQRPADGTLDMSFDDPIPSEEKDPRDPVPGSLHEYRGRAVDVIGRPGPWVTAPAVRLEKHVPPPVPPGPEGERVEGVDETTGPRGVRARVLTRGPGLEDEIAQFPGLTADERDELLRMRSTGIVLEWGWHAQQRTLDPAAREFRVYVGPELDRVDGVLVSSRLNPDGTRRARVRLERPIRAGAAAGTTLEAGYAFQVLAHGAGTEIDLELEARLRDRDGRAPVPAPGPVALALRLTAADTRPPAWDARAGMVPIDHRTRYRAILVDRLVVDDAHPRAAMWVGVSAADDQAYVPDQRAALEPAPRPGNESGIAIVQCSARLRERPALDVRAALADVAVIRAREAEGQRVRVELDLVPPAAAAGLGAGERVRPERVFAESVHAAYRLEGDPGSGVAPRLLALTPKPIEGEPEHTEITLGDLRAEDAADVRAGVNADTAAGLGDRELVYLAARHPYASRLFSMTGEKSLPLGRLTDWLPPDAGRWVYRLRRANGAELLSEGGAVLPLVVRVPSPVPPAAPRVDAVTAEAGGVVLRVSVPADDELTHVVGFSSGTAAATGTLVRVPGRPELPLELRLRLRTEDGWGSAVVAPVVREVDPYDETRPVELRFADPAGAGVRVWACAVSADGIPSTLVGPLSPRTRARS